MTKPASILAKELTVAAEDAAKRLTLLDSAVRGLTAARKEGVTSTLPHRMESIGVTVGALAEQCEEESSVASSHGNDGYSILLGALSKHLRSVLRSVLSCDLCAGEHVEWSIANPICDTCLEKMADDDREDIEHERELDLYRRRMDDDKHPGDKPELPF